MVRKTMAAVLLGAVFGAALLGCGGDQEAIQRYVGQQLKPALEVEAAALAPLWTLSSGGQGDSERLAKERAGQVLPAYERFLNEFAVMTVAEPGAGHGAAPPPATPPASQRLEKSHPDSHADAMPV